MFLLEIKYLPVFFLNEQDYFYSILLGILSFPVSRESLHKQHECISDESSYIQNRLITLPPAVHKDTNCLDAKQITAKLHKIDR